MRRQARACAGHVSTPIMTTFAREGRLIRVDRVTAPSQVVRSQLARLNPQLAVRRRVTSAPARHVMSGPGLRVREAYGVAGLSGDVRP